MANSWACAGVSLGDFGILLTAVGSPRKMKSFFDLDDGLRAVQLFAQTQVLAGQGGALALLGQPRFRLGSAASRMRCLSALENCRRWARATPPGLAACSGALHHPPCELLVQSARGRGQHSQSWKISIRKS